MNAAYYWLQNLVFNPANVNNGVENVIFIDNSLI